RNSWLSLTPHAGPHPALPQRGRKEQEPFPKGGRVMVAILLYDCRVLARRWLTLIVAGLFLIILPLPVSAASTDWPTYHATNFRDGNDLGNLPFSAIGQQWISPVLDGRAY